MTDTRPAILLTGFGPFPGVTDNATARLVPRLAAKARTAFPAFAFYDATLPVEWQAAPQRLADLITKHRPVLALHFGVAHDVHGFRIETLGMNICRLAEDAAGCLPVTDTLDAGGPSSRNATLPTEAIVARLTSLAIPAALSTDAGAYLCNAVLYHTLRHASAAKHPCRAGFIHIPADVSGPPLSFETVLRGAFEIIAVCLADLPPRAATASGGGADLA